MLQFVVTNIFMVSLGVILYVAVRTLPRLDEAAAPEKKGAWERWLASGVPEKVDKALNSFLAKFLRRLKVILLRADNAVTAQLKKVKPEANGAQRQNIDFRAIKEEHKGENKEGNL